MNVNIKKIQGTWDEGYVLDRHIVHSDYLGEDERGNPRYNTIRSEAGEALYQLKYNKNLTNDEAHKYALLLAKSIRDNIIPRFNDKIQLIIPVPPSESRSKQPVQELANMLHTLTGFLVSNDIITRIAPKENERPLKDIKDYNEKIEALKGKISLNDTIKDGCQNVLVIDDLFDSGATMNAVCNKLRAYSKIRKIYVVAITYTSKNL